MKIQIAAVILLSYCSHISRSCSRISCNWKLVCIQTLGYQENLRIFRVEGLPAWKANAKLQRPSLLPQVGKPWEFFHWMFGLTKFGFCADVLKSQASWFLQWIHWRLLSLRYWAMNLPVKNWRDWSVSHSCRPIWATIAWPVGDLRFSSFFIWILHSFSLE